MCDVIVHDKSIGSGDFLSVISGIGHLLDGSSLDTLQTRAYLANAFFQIKNNISLCEADIWYLQNYIKQENTNV